MTDDTLKMTARTSPTEYRLTKTPPAFDPMDIQIGWNMRQVRTAQRMSLQALADQIGITYQQIQKYEKGHNRVAATTLVRIAIVLNTPISDFLAGIDGIGTPAKPGASHLNACMERIRAKAPEVSQRLAALAQAMADGDLTNAR